MTEKIPLRETEELRAARWRRIAVSYRTAAEAYEQSARAWRFATLFCFAVAAATLLWGLLR